MRIAWQIAQESPTVDYAGIWIRLLAALIDGAILGAVVWVFNGVWSLAFGLGWMGTAADPGMSYGEVGVVYWVLQLLIPFLMATAYLIGFWGWRGQTPGKMAVRIKIVRFAGGYISWAGAVMRFLGYIISLLFFLTGFIWIAFDSRRQGFHDKIGETFVIRVPRQ